MLKIIVSLVLDLAVAVAVVWNVVRGLCDPEHGSSLKERCATFRYFTTDSNILCALSCAAAVPYLLMSIGGGAVNLPSWIHGFRYAGTVTVTVTFLTVMFFLGPVFGYGKMLGGSGLWLHLLCPLMTLVSFLWSENNAPVGSVLPGILPVVLYGLVYLYQVVIRKENKWDDFYAFNRGGRWPLSMVAMFAGALIISWALLAIRGCKV